MKTKWMTDGHGYCFLSFRSNQCSITGVTKTVVCAVLYVVVHIKEPLLLIGKNSFCGSREFPLSLSVWSFIICPTPYNRNKIC